MEDHAALADATVGAAGAETAEGVAPAELATATADWTTTMAETRADERLGEGVSVATTADQSARPPPPTGRP